MISSIFSLNFFGFENSSHFTVAIGGFAFGQISKDPGGPFIWEVVSPPFCINSSGGWKASKQASTQVHTQTYQIFPHF